MGFDLSLKAAVKDSEVLEELVYKHIIKSLEIYDSSWNTVFILKYLIKSGYTIHIEVSY